MTFRPYTELDATHIGKVVRFTDVSDLKSYESGDYMLAGVLQALIWSNKRDSRPSGATVSGEGVKFYPATEFEIVTEHSATIK